MLSADPTIPEPGNLQAYSRYAYVFNDPINRWDPSGYKPKWGQLLAGIIIGALTQQWYLVNFGAGTAPVAAAGWVSAEGAAIVATSGFTTGSLVTAGALGGFAGGLVSSGGDLRSAAAGALTGGMFGFAGALGQAGNVGGQMGMHAAAGCVSGALGGGGAEGCARGAIAQSFSKMVTIETRDFFKGNVVAHGVIASVSGGTVSAMMGGKFANGAMTGAFGYVLNEMLSRADGTRYKSSKFKYTGERSALDVLTVTVSEFVPTGQRVTNWLGVDWDQASGIEVPILTAPPWVPNFELKQTREIGERLYQVERVNTRVQFEYDGMEEISRTPVGTPQRSGAYSWRRDSPSISERSRSAICFSGNCISRSQ
jgi:hypothetical protein